MTAVALRVYANDLATQLAELDQPFAIAWDRQRKDAGSGQFTLPHDSPVVQATPDLLDRDNLVVVTVDGQDEFAWIIRRRARARGDVWDPIQVTGPGALEILRQALVYNRGGLDALVQADERLFGWMTRDYSLGPEWQEVDGARIGAPLSTPGFVDDRAVAFEPTSSTRHLYLRDLLASPDLAGPARMLLAATIGTSVKLYLDGDEIMEKKAGEQGLVTLDIDYRDDIDQLLGARVEAHGGPQPGRWGWTWIQLRENPDDPGGEPVYGSVIRRTFDPADFPDADSPWLVWDETHCPPVTPGFILGTLFDEWRDGDDRGGILAITRDFTATHDSAGNEWDGLCEMAVMVGDDNVLSVAERLQDHGVDTELGPDLVFRAYQHRGVDRGATPDDGLTTVVFDLDVVRGVSTETEDELINVILARTDEAWIERPTPRVTSGRREAFLSLGLTPSEEGGARISDDVLADFQTVAQVMRWTINSAQDGAPSPTVEYDLGDTLVGPWVNPDTIAAPWRYADLRVDAIAASVDQVGEVDWVLETSDGVPVDVPSDEPEPWAWYHGDDLSSGSVSSWPDRAGGAGPVTSVEGADFEHVADAVGGQPGARGGGGWGWLTVPKGTFDVTADGATVAFVVSKGDFASVALGRPGGGEQYFYVDAGNPDFGGTVFASGALSGMDTATNPGVAPDGSLVVARWASSGITIHINNVEVASNGSAPAPGLDATGVSIESMVSRFADVMLWLRALDDGEMGQLWAYAQGRYGL